MALADSGGCIEDSGNLDSGHDRSYESGTCRAPLCESMEESVYCLTWEDILSSNCDELFMCFDCGAGSIVAHVAVWMSPVYLDVSYFDVDGDLIGSSRFATDFDGYCCGGRRALTYGTGVADACLNPTPAVDPDTADTGATKTSSTADSKSCGGGQATVWAGLLALLGGSLLRRGSRP
jgi:hypothetical protein